MDFEDLKTAWRELDRRLAATEARELKLAGAVALGRTETALRRFVRLPLFELGSALILLIVAGATWPGPGAGLPVIASALVLHALAVVLIASSVWQLATIRRLDYAEPVLTIQRRLEALKAHRVRVTRWILLTAPLLWIFFAIVGAHALLNFDLVRGFGVPWVAANLLFGAAFVPLAIFACRRIARRPQSATWVRSLVDDIAGKRLVTAIGFLDELDGFEQER